MSHTSFSKFTNQMQSIRWATAFLFTSVVAFIMSLGYMTLFPIVLNQRVILQPFLLVNGFIPYQHIADQKSPLLPQFIAWIWPIFAHDAVQTARFTHVALITLTMMICLLWTYKMGGGWALIASGAYVLAWSNSFGYWATAYYDLALGPFYFLLFILCTWKTKKIAMQITAGGVIIGIAILIKQYAALLLFGTHAILADIGRRRFRSWLPFLACPVQIYSNSEFEDNLAYISPSFCGGA